MIVPPAPPAFDRQRSLARLGAEPFDVLVIGGGATGCGVALDAAARGLRTALVEADDFASGTSSRSSKLVHGGLRYLQQHDYRLVYEALAERQHLLANAPHLVHPLPFLIPLFGPRGAALRGMAGAYDVALWLYDLTGGLRIGKRHQRITADEASAHFPVLRAEQLAASFLYWDAQVDDARLVLALARTAASYGAVVANHVPVADLLSGGRRVQGARLADGTEVAASVVVNATGVWSEEVARTSGAPSPVRIRPAKGIHLAVPAERLPCDYASVLRVPGDQRTIFVVPWAADEAPGPAEPGRFTYLGTTDTDYDGPLDDPRCTPEDVAYVLGAVNAWTTARLTPDDITGTWAGLRPLVSDASSARTADLSRRHTVVTSPAGLVTVTGGKLTTYRRMAADTVDAAARQLGRRVGRSLTRHLPLWGAEGVAELRAPGAAATLGTTDRHLAHLAGRYGHEARTLLAMCAADPDLARPLAEGLPYVRAEVVFACRYEMAQTVADALARRTRAAILDREAAAAAAPDAGTLMAEELGWPPDRQASEVAAFLTAVDSERQALATAGPRRG